MCKIRKYLRCTLKGTNIKKSKIKIKILIYFLHRNQVLHFTYVIQFFKVALWTLGPVLSNVHMQFTKGFTKYNFIALWIYKQLFCKFFSKNNFSRNLRITYVNLKTLGLEAFVKWMLPELIMNGFKDKHFVLVNIAGISELGEHGYIFVLCHFTFLFFIAVSNL